MSNIKVIFDVKAWVSNEQKRWDNMSKEMANDVLTRAKMNAPVDSGALVASGKVTKSGKGTYSVTFGNARVRYARIREKYNRKNPSTTRYLESAAKSVEKGNISKYLR